MQDSRKQAGLEVSDRIILGVSGTKAIEAALNRHRDYLMTETLAIQWETDQAEPLFTDEKSLGDDSWRIELRKSS